MYYGLFNDAVSSLDYLLVVTNDANDDQWNGCPEMMWEEKVVASFEILLRQVLYTPRKTILSQPI